MPTTRTWAKVWAAMPESDRESIRLACHSRLVVPPSDLEVRFIKVLLKHNEPFEFQVKVPGTRYKVDFKVRGQLWETFGCGYHQCPTCGNNWHPEVREKDAIRYARCFEMGYPYEVVWNHETTEHIEKRLVMAWNGARAERLDCPEHLGTHKCTQLNGDHATHYCPCTGDDTRRWKTGQKPTIKDFRPDMITGEHVVELRKLGLIK